LYFLSNNTNKAPLFQYLRIVAAIVIILLFLGNLGLSSPDTNKGNAPTDFIRSDGISGAMKDNQGIEISNLNTRGSIRDVSALGFEESSAGLPSTGDYNFATAVDFNNDSKLDLAFGGEDWDVQNTVGLYAYTGNGGSSWTSSSTGLWPGNSWGGLAFADADEDGYIELYATDEDWGSKNNSGVKVWEFRNGRWNDSSVHVSSPDTYGQPCNVIITNVTGDSRLDMVVMRYSGVKYFENQGGNPCTWKERSSGLRQSDWFTAGAVGDLNKDGLPDIVAGRYSGEHLWVQSTTGNLWADYSSTVNAPGYQIGAVIADVNNDTHMDIIFGTTTPSNGYGVYCLLGNSGGMDGKSFSWTKANTGLPTIERYGQIQVVDIDQDGDLDIIAPCATNDNGIEIYLGNGSTNPGMDLGWTKATGINLTNKGDWYGTWCADINQDGSQDIIGASWGSGVRVWLNNLTRDVTPPGAINDLKAVEYTEDSIKVTWSAPADNGTDVSSGPVQSYDIRYSTKAITSKNWLGAVKCIGIPQPLQPGTEQEFNITNLAMATQYYIALRSVDEVPNISPISNIVVQNTLGMVDTTPPAKINDLHALNPTNNSIDLTWTAPADNGSDLGSGTVIEYEVRYYSAKITASTWALAVKYPNQLTPATPGSTEILTVSGLLGDIEYFFAVKARDERPNWGEVSNSATEVTLPDPDLIPPAAVNDLAASDATISTVELSWTAPGDDGSAGTAQYYDIRYSTAVISSLTWDYVTECKDLPVPKSPGSNEHYQVTGLTPDTKYFFALKTADEVPTWSELSNIAEATTILEEDLTPPGKIDDLVVVTETETSLTLTWTAPGDDDVIGTATSYDMRYHDELINDDNWDLADVVQDPPVPKTAGETETITVSDLTPDTDYYFALRVGDERPNWSPISNSAKGRTLNIDLNDLLIMTTPSITSLLSGEQINIAINVISKSTSKHEPMVNISLSSDLEDLSIVPSSGVTDSAGQFIITILAPEVESSTEVSITIKVSKDGFRSNQSTISFIILPQLDQAKFNLHIPPDGIKLSKSPIYHDDEIIISANVTNNGDINSGLFTVKYYINEKLLSENIIIQDLPSGGYIQIDKTWFATAGDYEVRIEIIPSAPHAEANAEDNSAKTSMVVKSKESTVDDDTKGGDDEAEESGSGSTIIGLTLVIIIVFILLLVIFIHRRKIRDHNIELGTQEQIVAAPAPEERVAEETVAPEIEPESEQAPEPSQENEPESEQAPEPSQEKEPEEEPESEPGDTDKPDPTQDTPIIEETASNE
jgi:hypothetical protein